MALISLRQLLDHAAEHRYGLPAFNEVNCRQGSLGRFEAKHLMPQLLAAAGRLAKYGA